MQTTMIRARGARAALRMAVLASLLALAWQPATAPAQLPSLGDHTDLSVSQERRIGERIVRELYRDPDYIDDPTLADYIQALWQPLLAAARLRGELPPELDQRFAWQLLLGKDRSINAFALPGGWFGLHLGLVATTGSRDELASVLAHELSHVTQRHISRMVTQDRQQQPWVIGSMILGSLAVGRNPAAAQALIAGGQALAIQGQLKFSRDMEREADRVGLGVLTQAGFNGQGFPAMFEKLQNAARLNDDGSFPYLRTHPLTVERLADMRARLPVGERPAAPPNDLQHTLMAARARALSADGVDGLRALVREAEGTLGDRLRQAGALYAGTLAASRLREPAVAQRLLARLEPLVTGEERSARAGRLLAAELALAANDAARVSALVQGAAPTARPELLLAAQAAVKAGRPAEASQRLQTWVTLNPGDATAWQALAMALQAQGEGQALRAIRAEAEAQVARLDYGAAMDRLRAAQALARRPGADHFEASIIDTRARQVESLLREQALER